MDSGSSEESEISDSEIFEYKEKPYGLLTSGKLKVKGPHGTLRCPFCAGKKKQDYKYKDLLQHATGAGKVSSNRRAKQKANHLALAEYLENELANEAEQLPARVLPPAPAPAAPQSDQNGLLFVPWTGVVVNIVKRTESGKCIFSKEYLMEMFYKCRPKDVVLFWDDEKNTGQAIVQFDNNWAGYRNCMEFEKNFEADHCSKKDWVSNKAVSGVHMYGWFARADDYESAGVIGDYLRKNGELKTISDIVDEEDRGRQDKIYTLAYELDKKIENLDDLQIKYNEKNMSLSRLLDEKDKLHQDFFEETRRMQRMSRAHIQRVLAEQELLNSDLEKKRKELDSWSRELNRRETRTERDRLKLDEEKNKNDVRNSSLQLASVEQKKADENVLRLVEEQQREKEEALKDILKLERELDEKLEMEIAELKGKLEVMKHLGNEDDEAVQSKMKEMQELEEKEDHRTHMETLNQTLLIKERQSNDELQEARKSLIKGLEEILSGPRTNISVKRMGEIDVKVFQPKCKERFSGDEADIKALEMCSLWQENIKNSEWHPYKIVTVEGSSEQQLLYRDQLEMEGKKTYKAHVMVLAYHGQGHINPMVQLSKRLASKGMKVTVCAMRSTVKAMESASSTVIFESIYDDTTEGGVGAQGGFKAFLERFEASCLRNLAELIKKQKLSEYPVKCLVYDANLPWASVIAKDFAIIGAAFFTQSCAAVASYYPMHYDILEKPLPLPAFSMPGLPPPKLPNLTSLGAVTGKHSPIIKQICKQFDNIEDAEWVLFNSFDKLEEEVVMWMSNLWTVRNIGPTVPSVYLDNRVENDNDYGFNMYKPSTEACMQWLNTKETGSVIYVSFGSAASLNADQMAEMGEALKLCAYSFLWVVKPTEQSKLPANFIEETSEKGLIVAWCPQLEVLAHKAVGCFVSHCGWNSAVEAISFGVPVVAMPQFLDQVTNAYMVERVWGVGIQPKENEQNRITAKEIGRCINEVMNGEEIRKKAIQWKSLAKEAIDENGSSDIYIDEIVSRIVAL